MRYILALCLFFVLCITNADAVTRYVCNNATNCNAEGPGGWVTGSNTGPATSRFEPWFNLDYAEENADCGDTVVVGNGFYTGDAAEWDQVVLWFEKSCTLGNELTFQSENRHGAIINPGTTGHSGIWIDSRFADHIIIDGFQIINAEHQGISAKDTDTAAPYTRAVGVQLLNLHIHDVGEGCEREG